MPRKIGSMANQQQSDYSAGWHMQPGHGRASCLSLPATIASHSAPSPGAHSGRSWRLSNAGGIELIAALLAIDSAANDMASAPLADAARTPAAEQQLAELLLWEPGLACWTAARGPIRRHLDSHSANGRRLAGQSGPARMGGLGEVGRRFFRSHPRELRGMDRRCCPFVRDGGFRPGPRHSRRIAIGRRSRMAGADRRGKLGHRYFGHCHFGHSDCGRR